MTTLPFCMVDAFAEQPYRGNAAGVVLEADRLTETQMQRIAREVNVSETAFVSRTHDLHRPPRVRWFTPHAEVRFCGHATLAAAHALHESGGLGDLVARPGARLVLDSDAGELSLTPETLPAPYSQVIWWLEMPEPRLRPDYTNPIRTVELLGLSGDDLEAALPVMRTRDDDLIFMIRSVQRLMEMHPRFPELGDWCRRHEIRGICVATVASLADSINVQSRFFAPAVGVDEDPVTGSVHGPLAIFLVVNGLVSTAGGRAALFCAQGIPGDRSGLVRVLTESTPRGYRARIAGLCHTTVTGQVLVPPT